MLFRSVYAFLDLPRPQRCDELGGPSPETARNVQPTAGATNKLYPAPLRYFLHQRNFTAQIQRGYFDNGVDAFNVRLGQVCNCCFQGPLPADELAIREVNAGGRIDQMPMGKREAEIGREPV